ncbi:CPBP family intramembrane glutamic endopeptidase [Hyphobacterium sp. HN65]|uniref:CPBP family intramembrane glutamic endopeptidase n=1 Tax=Hyphobacterium lacteum TaxID=3116575 RepID=A0ABU7LRC6_9PROT|nr:CPBP family intramembrane glutamic endopeptidase [Hyphobacterium sp. HN65]MEE2526461.1 CPBP family intramembrane glutamic endopeptidase [Hyphobacterium sp. HN65]
MTDISSPRSRFAILVELGIVLTVLIGSKLLFDQIAWRFAGPLSLLCTLITIYFFARGNQETVSDFGLIRLRKWWSFPLILPQSALATVAIIASGAGMAYLGGALGFWPVEEVPSGVEDRWGNIVGNFPVYLGWLAIVWTSAAFGEEIFFRSYLIRRVEALLPGVKWAAALAVIIAATGFGIAHMYYQGVRGLVVTGVIGLALGTLYLVYKRNLWPLVLAHGAVDTLAFTAMYLDLDI